MTDVQAAMGRIQLGRLNEFVEKRNKIFQFYKKLNLSLLQFLEVDPKLEFVPYRCILMNNNPKSLIKKFAEKEIEIINPLEEWELLGSKEKFLASFKMTQKTVSLPCYPSLTDENLKKIENTLIVAKDLL